MLLCTYIEAPNRYKVSSIIINVPFLPATRRPLSTNPPSLYNFCAALFLSFTAKIIVSISPILLLNDKNEVVTYFGLQEDHEYCGYFPNQQTCLMRSYSTDLRHLRKGYSWSSCRPK